MIDPVTEAETAPLFEIVAGIEVEKHLPVRTEMSGLCFRDIESVTSFQELEQRMISGF